jgi:hypothetical protein
LGEGNPVLIEKLESGMRVLDVCLTAGPLVKIFGLEGATLTAVSRADSLLAEGDIEGHRAWSQVVATLREIERPKPPMIRVVN